MSRPVICRSLIRFSPPRRGRVREGVERYPAVRHSFTPILTFPRQEQRYGSSRVQRMTKHFALIIATFLITGSVQANPFLPKPGEPPISARVGTCSITGGFIHFYSALYNGLFDKYGLKIEHHIGAKLPRQLDFTCTPTDQRDMGSGLFTDLNQQ